MIVVRLAGGLGNQMFEYAFGRRLAHDYNWPIALDATYGFKNDPYRRRYALGCFNIQERFARQDQIPFYLKHGRILRHLGFIVQSLLPDSARSLIREKREYVYAPDAVRVRQPGYVVGYWQCEAYIKPIEDIVRREFAFKLSPSLPARQLAFEMQRDDSVSVHVRRLHGISANGKPIPVAVRRHGLLSVEYLNKAVDIVLERVRQPRLFVFSDAPDWCKQNLSFPVPVTYVADTGVGLDTEELYLMSQCRHHIISNSSFSWWGAWLGKDPNGMVVAPCQFLNEPSFRSMDLFPANWLVI